MLKSHITSIPAPSGSNDSLASKVAVSPDLMNVGISRTIVGGALTNIEMESLSISPSSFSTVTSTS